MGNSEVFLGGGGGGCQTFFLSFLKLYNIHPSNLDGGSSEIESWLKANSISHATCDRLNREKIRKLSDVRLMTKEDILDLNLPLGERIRLRELIETLRQEDRKNAPLV